MALPPGPSNPLYGALALLRGRSRLSVLADLSQRYGDVVYFRTLGDQYAVLNHPDYARDVLVTQHRLFHKGVGLERAKLLLGEGLLTSEDELHQRQRRLLQPAFHRERIAAYAATMTAYTLRRSQEWTASAAFDMAREMSALTLTIAGKTLFDADVEGDAQAVGAALTAAVSSFNVTLLPFGNILAKLPIPPAVRFRRARRRLDAIVYRLIAERRARGGTGEDVLSMLVSARDTETDGRGMDDGQIRDEAMTLLLAGHETTANALTWSWYLLSQHPEIERRLHEEVDGVLGGRTPALDDLPHLTYTRAVIAETMRLYPPAYLVGRRALAPYPVPGTAYVIPARTVVLISQYLLQRDPRFWRDPERFDPQRWSEGMRRGERHQYGYFPFGAGPRVCIGEHFAWMEAILVLATIAQRWTLRLAPDQRVEPQPIITLRPKYGLRMIVSPRSAPVAAARASGL